jgi:hypothetical protein
MNGMRTVSTVSVAFVLALMPLSARSTPPTRTDKIRTVFISAVDAKGESVTDVTAADLTVKEGGKDRAIATLQAATGPVQMSILVDDGGSGSFQQGVVTMLTLMLGHAEYAISLLNPQPIKLADYSTDRSTLNEALARLVQRGRIQQDGFQLVEAVSWSARELIKRKAPRPVIVLITNGGEPPGGGASRDFILADLKASRASLNVIYVNGIDFGKVLSEGPKNSGGLLENASSNRAIDTAMAKIAANLLHQYVLTYTLPEGTKLDERLQVTTTRKGIRVLAPQKIADK